MKIITLQMLRQKLDADAKSERGCGLILLGILAFFVIGGAATAAGLTDLLLPLVLFGGGGLFFLLTSHKKRNKVQSNSFYLTTEVCSDKKFEAGGEDADTYLLIFESGLSRDIKTDDVQFSAIPAVTNIEALYNLTQPGDAFYALYLAGHDAPLYVFSQRFCQLDMTGFVVSNGRIYPKYGQ